MRSIRVSWVQCILIQHSVFFLSKIMRAHTHCDNNNTDKKNPNQIDWIVCENPVTVFPERHLFWHITIEFPQKKYDCHCKTVKKNSSKCDAWQACNYAADIEFCKFIKNSLFTVFCCRVRDSNYLSEVDVFFHMLGYFLP